MSEFINYVDTTGLVIQNGALASFSEKTLHLEQKRWDLPYVKAARNIASVSYDYLNERGVKPVEAFVKRQHELELRKKKQEVSMLMNELFFEQLLQKEEIDTEVDWRTLQDAQTQHDWKYHADVVLPDPVHHLQHNVLHITMTAGKIMQAMLAGDVSATKEHYISTLIFGVKSLTAFNVRLPEITGSPRLWGDILY